MIDSRELMVLEQNYVEEWFIPYPHLANNEFYVFVRMNLLKHLTERLAKIEHGIVLLRWTTLYSLKSGEHESRTGFEVDKNLQQKSIRVCFRLTFAIDEEARS